MHFHLPKPLHGWREFAGEVGIIVLGVLIALGAEQLVEQAHQRQEGVEAEHIIRNEISLNLGRLESRTKIYACVNRRIEELQKLLDGAASNPAIATPGWIGRPQYWTFLDSRWQAESQAGQAALVNAQRLPDYGIMYNRMQNLQDEMALEQTDWAKLRTLEHIGRLDPAAALEFNVTLQDARYRNWRIALVTDQLFAMEGARNGGNRQRDLGRPLDLPADRHDARRGQQAQRLACRRAVIEAGPMCHCDRRVL